MAKALNLLKMRPFAPLLVSADFSVLDYESAALTIELRAPVGDAELWNCTRVLHGTESVI